VTEQARVRRAPCARGGSPGGLAHRFGGDRAAVDYGEVFASRQQAAQALAFGKVQPASQRHDFERHTGSWSAEVRWIECAAKALGSAAGHDDLAVLAPVDAQRAPGRVTVTLRLTSPGASPRPPSRSAPVPQARVSPAPRSQTRRRTRRAR
jgi:hypothetical protein